MVSSIMHYKIIYLVIALSAVTYQEQISTAELKKLSSELFDLLPNNIYPHIKLNYQGHKNSSNNEDKATEPLISVSSELLNMIPTIQLMRKLYDNYDANYLHQEQLTPEKDKEEDMFIEAILDTQILKKIMDFLALKGYFSKDINEYKKILKIIWFDYYARNKDAVKKNVTGSCAFEHVFMIEVLPKRRVTGMHNWIFFTTEESTKKIDYLGYIKKVVSNKFAAIKFDFKYEGKAKVSSMFIGTPPEFDIALYTLCFYARPNRGCKIVLDKEKYTIVSYKTDTSKKQLHLATVFPIL